MSLYSRLFPVIAAIALCASASLLAADVSAPATVADVGLVGLDAAALKTMALTPRTPAPASVLLSGVSQPSSSVLFKSDAIVVVLYAEQPIRLALKAPGMPYDEYVHIVDGALLLSDAGGQVREFVAGDSVLIPKGFIGTWETRANFRELAVVSRKDWDATH